MDQADLEQRARELEQRAVDADEALNLALADRAGGRPAGRKVSASELRRLQAEADGLIERALTARLEADRAAGPAGEGGRDDAAALPVTSWSQRELGFEQLLEAAIDEEVDDPQAAPTDGEQAPGPPKGRNGDPGAGRSGDRPLPPAGSRPTGSAG